MEELIAKRYATALSAVSKDMSTISEVLNTLTEVIEKNDVKRVLTSPIVSDKNKTDIILSSLGTNTDKVLINFIKVLGENKRLDLIPAIAKVINSDLQKKSNKYEGVLKSSKKLSNEDLKNLETTLEKYTSSKIKLTQKVTDLDGLRVSVDDLGIEVNFSKQRVKEQLIDFIQKSL
ncbi:ATP synthase delta chain [hydrothermal vent metagenome]|uniref:ATP synthase delta chain n=1 Tax=hydrothermal vent metagenome TaxID=652676 RepID=A0A1W1EDB2_9ZZZZ